MGIQTEVENIQAEVRKEMTIETKLLMGFIMVYLASVIVPPVITYIIDSLIVDGIVSNAMVGLISFCVLLILISILANYLIKWITQPIRKLSLAAESMVRGDLDVDLEVESSWELESIARSLERMKASLKIALDWLGPPELVKYKPKEKDFGQTLNDKIIIGMLVFLIANPIVIGLSHGLFPDSIFFSSLISILFSIILLAFISNYLYRLIIKPLGRIANQVERISQGDFSEPIKLEGSGEIGRLEHSFKLLADRVQRAMKELSLDG